MIRELEELTVDYNENLLDGEPLMTVEEMAELMGYVMDDDIEAEAPEMDTFWAEATAEEVAMVLSR